MLFKSKTRVPGRVVSFLGVLLYAAGDSCIFVSDGGI